MKKLKSKQIKQWYEEQARWSGKEAWGKNWHSCHSQSTCLALQSIKKYDTLYIKLTTEIMLKKPWNNKCRQYLDFKM